MDRRPEPPRDRHAALARRPFGPWQVDGDLPPEETTEELGFGGAPSGFDDTADLGPPLTGTALDEFLPVYWYLGHPGKHRPAYTAGEVDRLDLSVVAMLLGVRPVIDGDEFGPLTGDFEADSARLIARRIAAAREKDRLAALGEETGGE